MHTHIHSDRSFLISVVKIPLKNQMSFLLASLIELPVIWILLCMMLFIMKNASVKIYSIC